MIFNKWLRRSDECSRTLPKLERYTFGLLSARCKINVAQCRDLFSLEELVHITCRLHTAATLIHTMTNILIPHVLRRAAKWASLSKIVVGCLLKPKDNRQSKTIKHDRRQVACVPCLDNYVPVNIRYIFWEQVVISWCAVKTFLRE